MCLFFSNYLFFVLYFCNHIFFVNLLFQLIIKRKFYHIYRKKKTNTNFIQIFIYLCLTPTHLFVLHCNFGFPSIGFFSNSCRQPNSISVLFQFIFFCINKFYLLINFKTPYLSLYRPPHTPRNWSDFVTPKLILCRLFFNQRSLNEFLVV